MLFPFRRSELFTVFGSDLRRGEQVCFSETAKFWCFPSPGSAQKKKAAGKAAPNGAGRQRPQVLGRALCRSGFFSFGRLFFSLDITRPAFSVFNFIGLFAHTSVFTSATYSDFVLALWKLGRDNSTSIWR